jgi:hypothetical protein
LPRHRQQLAKPCPQCGREQGFVYLQTWVRPYKKKIDYNTGLKYIDYEHPLKKKLLSEPDPLEVILSEGNQQFINSYLKIWEALRDIIPLMFGKYRQSFEEGEYQEVDITFVTKGIDILYKALTPFSSKPLPDNRSIYGLDFSQWSGIALYTKRHSYREAARKFGLSVNRMKRQLKLTDAVAEEFATYLPNLIWFISKMKRLKIMSTDMELKSQFDTSCKAIFRKLREDQLSVIERAKLESRRDQNNSDIHKNEKQGRRYRYYQIIHGKKEKRCGPFKESELPLELLMQYRQKHQNKRIDNTDSQNYKNNNENNPVKIMTYVFDSSNRLKTLKELYLFFLT